MATLEDTNKPNWGRRIIDSRGSHVRIESGSALIGRDGAETFKIYAVNDNEEVFLITHGHGSGLGRMACDKSIEIRAGDKNNPNSVDIRVSAATGDITINADRGRVRVNAKDIGVHAERDIDLNAGRNVNIKAGTGRILLKANTVSSHGKKGNLIPKTWGAKVLANSYVPDDSIAKFFDPKSQSTSLGAGPFSDNGVAGAAADGLGFSLQDLGITNPEIGGIEPIENALEKAVLGLESPLADLTNFIEGEGANKLTTALGGLEDKLGDKFKGLSGKLGGSSGFGGFSSLVDKASGVISDGPSSLVGGALVDKFKGATDLASGGGLINSASGLILDGTETDSGVMRKVLKDSAIGKVSGIGKNLAAGEIGSLTASAKSLLGVTQGGHSLTGVVDQIASGTVGKGAAATVGNKSGDPLAVMDSIVPSGFNLAQVKSLKKTVSERLNIADAATLAAEEAQKDITRAIADTQGVVDMASDEIKVLLEGGSTTGKENKTFNV